MLRCRRAVDTAGDTSDCPDASSSWASLPGDLVDLIGWRVLETSDLLDYVRLRAVCDGWRSATVSPRGRGLHDTRFHPRRWMVHPEGHGIHRDHDKLGEYIRFLNLSTGAFVRVRLPFFTDHYILDSVDGILLLQRDHDTAVCLLHPFTGDIAELPPFATLKIQKPLMSCWAFRSVGATAFHAGADGVVTVMMALDRFRQVAYATTIDQQWKLSTWSIKNHWSPISFQGKIYLLDSPTLSSDLNIFEIRLPRREDVEGTGALRLLAPKLIVTCPAAKLHGNYHLAECDSEILLIGRSDSRSAHYLVYRLSHIMSSGKFVPMTSIGDNALFVDERVLSVSSRVHPTIAGDAIVILHPHSYYLGQYHLADRTWLPTEDGYVNWCYGIPNPCSLIYYIFTCCNRATWNKGALLSQANRQERNAKRKRRGGA